MKLVLALLFFIPLTCFAEDEEPSAAPAPRRLHATAEEIQANRAMTDIHYFPMPRRVFVVLEELYGLNTSRMRLSSDDSDLYKTKGDVQSTGLLAGYAFNEQFAAAIGVANGRTTNEYNFGNNSLYSGQTRYYTSRGAQDPFVQLMYRMIEEVERGQAVDIALTYSPKTVDATGPSTTAEGNFGRGGYKISPKLSYSRAVGQYQYGFSGEYEIRGPTTSRDATTGVASDSTAANVLILKAEFQADATDRLSIVGTLGYRATAGYDTNTPGSATTTTDPRAQGSASAELKYAAIPKRLMLRLGVEVDSTADYKMKLGPTEYKQNSDSTSYTAGLNGEF